MLCPPLRTESNTKSGQHDVCKAGHGRESYSVRSGWCGLENRDAEPPQMTIILVLVFNYYAIHVPNEKYLPLYSIKCPGTFSCSHFACFSVSSPDMLILTSMFPSSRFIQYELRPESNNAKPSSCNGNSCLRAASNIPRILGTSSRFSSVIAVTDSMYETCMIF